MKRIILIFSLLLSLSINIIMIKSGSGDKMPIQPDYLAIERALGETSVDNSTRSCVVNKINDKIKSIGNSDFEYSTLPWDDIIKYQEIYNDTDFDGGFFSRGTLPMNYLNNCYQNKTKMISIGDINNDSLPEILVLKNNSKFIELYINKGVNFFENKKIYTLLGNNVSAAGLLDINGDSFLDIILLSPTTLAIEIYYNKDGKIQEGVIYNNIFDDQIGHNKGDDWTVTFADLNKDGLADILYNSRSFGVNAKKLKEDGKVVRPIRVLYNNNDINKPFYEGTKNAFKEIDKGQKGLLRSSFDGEDLNYVVSGVYATGIADFNNDGWLDLYGAGDLMRPYLFIAEPGGLSYLDYSIKSNIRENGQNTMGVAVLDFNHDGYMDIIATDIDRNLNEDYFNRPAPPKGGHRLLINNKDLTFSDIGEKIDIANAGWGFGLSILDQNLDGYYDFLIATGDYPTGRNEMHWLSTYDKPYLLLQNQLGFTRGGEALLRAWRSPGVTPILYSGDLNNDLTPDIIFAGLESNNPYYIVNKSKGNSFNIMIKGKGLGGSPTGGEGSIIEISIKNKPKQIHTLPNLMSQFMASASNVPITFGLGEEKYANIVVKFPSGKTVERSVYHGKSYVIREP